MRTLFVLAALIIAAAAAHSVYAEEAAGELVLVAGATGGTGQHVVTELLGRGYRVRAFSKPRKALQAAAEDPEIALLLSDMSMPEMRGDELARRLRESRPDLPIIFMSGLVEPGALPNATYAKKPIDLDDLEGMIASILA